MTTLAADDAVTEKLAAFAVSPVDLADSTLAATRTTTANILSLIVGAASSAACNIAFDASGGDRRPPQATLFGTKRRSAVTTVALIGGIAAHLEDFDDTHLQTVIHPGAPVVPAAVALGEHLGCTYGEVLESVAVGAEVALRVGVGLGKSHFDRGWHITGTTGRLGAAASCARLLRLDPDRAVHALGIAATEAAGLQAAFGTMTKSFHAGKAASDGVEAALMAAAGFTASPTALEGARGLLPVTSAEPDADAVLRGLGEHWEIESNAIKPYACGIVSHPVIDAGIELAGMGLRSEAVRSVELHTNPVVLDVMGKEDPTNGLQSKFSVYHCFAVGLLYRRGGVEEFSDRVAVNRAVVDLRKLVRVHLDPAVARDECYAEVVDADGKVWRHHVEHATASKDRPMTADQLRSKMLALVEPVLGADRAGAFTRLLLNGDRSVPVADLAAAAVPGVGL